VRARFAAKGIDASNVDFLTFTDLEASLTEDVATYRASPLLRQDIPLRTFIFDVMTGRLREVEVAQ
ncbi:MAG: carbonic anhydrase, partial [Dehalococcoidia bacterium]|nr:carbonic anhydrase [Dehalococcoidia bacterium]